MPCPGQGGMFPGQEKRRLGPASGLLLPSPSLLFLRFGRAQVRPRFWHLLRGTEEARQKTL